jgi:hypothetical protein
MCKVTISQDEQQRTRNRELLDQAQRYDEASRAATDIATVALCYSAILATLQLYVMEECARLNEKLKQLERAEREKQ